MGFVVLVTAASYCKNLANNSLFWYYASIVNVEAFYYEKLPGLLARRYDGSSFRHLRLYVHNLYLR